MAESLIFLLGFYVPALAAIPNGARRSVPAPALRLPSIEREAAPRKTNRASVQLASQEAALAAESSPDHFQCYRTTGFCAADAPTRAGVLCSGESDCGGTEDVTAFCRPQ
ncbi:MAG: hypothetical protein ACREQJ_08455, partial [Candidatus Binatia bacterium]